jgi:murein DD-endopeptidase MepM/ murein hydrolase activator NlpD
MNKRILLLLLFFSVFLLSACSTTPNPTTDKPVAQTKTDTAISDTPVAKITSDSIVNPTDTTSGQISEPIDNALNRVTKKPFGIKVSPNNSPVSPEKFSGYHTGTDFETLPAEQDSDVKIYAVCTGPLLLKKYASGYGGVAVQQCNIEGSDVTVIYGHLKLDSISVETAQNLTSGELIGILGKGYSTETDGERKHLHLGVHKGKTISLLGYVQNKAQLDGWIDALTLLK